LFWLITTIIFRIFVIPLAVFAYPGNVNPIFNSKFTGSNGGGAKVWTTNPKAQDQNPRLVKEKDSEFLANQTRVRLCPSELLVVLPSKFSIPGGAWCWKSESDSNCWYFCDSTLDLGGFGFIRMRKEGLDRIN